DHLSAWGDISADTGGSIDFSGGSGNDSLSVGMGDLFFPRNTKSPGGNSMNVSNGGSVTIHGDDGDDSLTVRSNITGDSGGHVSIAGGNGNDHISLGNFLSGAIRIDRGASLSVSGDAGDDHISIKSHAAAQNGGSINISGGAGKDSISATTPFFGPAGAANAPIGAESAKGEESDADAEVLEQIHERRRQEAEYVEELEEQRREARAHIDRLHRERAEHSLYARGRNGRNAHLAAMFRQARELGAA
nr:hypothetical protein [Desulfovibrio sp.]